MDSLWMLDGLYFKLVNGMVFFHDYWNLYDVREGLCTLPIETNE